MRKRLAKITSVLSALIMIVVVLWFANQWFGWFSTDFFSRPAPLNMRPLAPFTDIVWGAGFNDMRALYGEPQNYNGSDNGAYASVVYQREILGQTARVRYEWEDHKLYHATLSFNIDDVAYDDLTAFAAQFSQALSANLEKPQSLQKERQRWNLPYEPFGLVWFYDAYIWDENSLIALNCHWSDAEQRLVLAITLDDAHKYGRERWLMERSALQPDGPERLQVLVDMPLNARLLDYTWGAKYGMVKKREGRPDRDISFPFYGGWREYYRDAAGFAYTVGYGFPWRKLANVNYNMELYGVSKDMAEAFADNLALKIAAELGQAPQKSTAREIQSERQSGEGWRGGANWLTDDTFVFFGVFWNEFSEHMTCYLAFGDAGSSQNEHLVKSVEQQVCEAP